MPVLRLSSKMSWKYAKRKIKIRGELFVAERRENWTCVISAVILTLRGTKKKAWGWWFIWTAAHFALGTLPHAAFNTNLKIQTNSSKSSFACNVYLTKWSWIFFQGCFTIKRVLAQHLKRLFISLTATRKAALQMALSGLMHYCASVAFSQCINKARPLCWVCI